LFDVDKFYVQAVADFIDVHHWDAISVSHQRFVEKVPHAQEIYRFYVMLY
jgi:hypothetical protein